MARVNFTSDKISDSTSNFTLQANLIDSLQRAGKRQTTMSILTSIFIDLLPSAKKRCKTLALPLKGIEHVYNVGAILDNETIGTLLGVIRGRKNRDPLLAEEIEFYDMRERVIFRVPDEIVQVLAESTQKEIESFSKSWKELDPSFGDVKKKYLKATLLAMQEASILALEENKPVLIYVST